MAGTDDWARDDRKNPVGAPGTGDDWLGITPDALPVAEAGAWATVPGCGAVVTFTGTVRDHAEGRPGVTVLEYEAYEGPAMGRLQEVAAEARRRWPVIGRIALVHRVGRLQLGDAAVVVVVSTPHRDEAFEAARWCIDTVKSSVPIWKKEEWAGGTDWGTGAQPIIEPRRSA
jgi:molybdopterin synthase catalytic subunit